MKHTNRILALIMVLALCLGVGSTALAADLTGITVDGGGRTYTDVNGSVTMQFVISNNSGHEIVLSNITPEDSSIFAVASANIEGTETEIKIPHTGKKSIKVTGVIKNSITESATQTPGPATGLIFYFNDTMNTASGTASCSDYTIKVQGPRPTESPDKTPTPEDKEAKLRISPVDAQGLVVPAPAGDYGETIAVRIPLICQRYSVYDVKIAPVLSNDIEKYPFDIEAVDYLLTYPNTVNVGNIIEFAYNLRLSKKATTGVKQVDFNLSYRVGSNNNFENGTAPLETATVSVFVNVKKGLAPTSSDGGGSTPKLIVESYSISSDKIYAGETFDVTVTIKNTSATETIQNLQLRFKDTAEVAKLVPASGGSNTIYISKIGKGESKTEVLSLQTPPDTEAKAYTLGLEFGYEGASTNTAYTANETIAIPILQKIRVKCDDPTIYDSEAWVGQSCGMAVRLYNMGKSTIYNSMVDVEGEGLEMEESYFGGNIQSGGTLSADFSVIPSVAGEIEGTVVITYEDVYGEPSEERLPFKLNVNEEVAMDPAMGMEGMEGMEGMGGMEGGIEVYGPGVEQGGGMPWWGWALCGLGVAGLGAGGFLFYRKKRARHLEDV